MTSTDSYKKVTLFTNPYGGRRDALWHVFEADFSAGAQAEFCSDDDESIWLALQDKDTGGNHADATAMPAAGAGGHAAAKRRRVKRQARAYWLVYAHCEDPMLKQRLRNLPKWCHNLHFSDIACVP